MKPNKFYNHRAGPATATCTGSGTALIKVLRRPEFWLFLLIHAGAIFAWRSEYIKNYGGMSISFLDTPWHDAGVITLITALSEVLYVGRCYESHVAIHDLTRQMAGALSDFAFRARLCMRSAGHPHDQVACRYLIVSLVLFLLEARGYTRGRSPLLRPGETWVSEDDWRRLLEKKLLKSDEASFLRGLTCQQRLHFLLRESGRLANEGLAKAKAPPEAAEEFADTLLTFRQRQEQALEAVRLPVPFTFFHLLNLMVLINLLLWAFALAMSESYLAPVIYLLSLTLSLSLLELGASLSQPFGDGSDQLPAAEWVEEVVESVNTILDYEYKGASGDWRGKLEQESSSSTKLNLGRNKVEVFLAY